MPQGLDTRYESGLYSRVRQPDEPPDITAQVVGKDRLRLIIQVMPDRKMSCAEFFCGSVEQVLAQRTADRAGRAIALFHEIVKRSSECALKCYDGVRNFKVGCEVACVVYRLRAVTADAFIDCDRNDFYLSAWREDLVQDVQERGAVLASAQCDSDCARLEVVLSEVPLDFARDIIDQVLLAEVHA